MAILTLGLLHASFPVPSTIPGTGLAPARHLAAKPTNLEVVTFTDPLPLVLHSGGFWNWLGGLAKDFLHGAVSSLGGSAMHWVWDKIGPKTSSDSRLKQIASSLSNISSVLGRMDQGLEEIVAGIAALNSELADIDATLHYIAEEIRELIDHFKFAEIEEAYAFIKRKHQDFAGCLQYPACLAKGNGSLFEFCHDDPVCENQLVDRLEQHLQTIHSFLTGTVDPITHRSKDSLINLTYQMVRNSSSTNFQRCRLSGPGGTPETYCEVLVALPMISYMMQAGMVQLQGFSMYVSILDRWNFAARAATATRQFRSRLDQQFAIAHANMLSHNMSSRIFEIAETMQTLVNGVKVLDMSLNCTSETRIAHCLPMIPVGGESCAPGQKGVCPEASRKCYNSEGECITYELGQGLGINDTLCCPGARCRAQEVDPICVYI